MPLPVKNQVNCRLDQHGVPSYGPRPDTVEVSLCHVPGAKLKSDELKGVEGLDKIDVEYARQERETSPVTIRAVFEKREAKLRENPVDAKTFDEHLNDASLEERLRHAGRVQMGIELNKRETWKNSHRPFVLPIYDRIIAALYDWRAVQIQSEVHAHCALGLHDYRPSYAVDCITHTLRMWEIRRRQNQYMPIKSLLAPLLKHVPREQEEIVAESKELARQWIEWLTPPAPPAESKLDYDKLPAYMRGPRPAEPEPAKHVKSVAEKRLDKAIMVAATTGASEGKYLGPAGGRILGPSK